MLRNKTVFVVGAGASHELGFPTGESLKAQMATALNIKLDAGRQKYLSGSWEVRESYLCVARGRQEAAVQYQNACLNIAAALPAAVSIDTYLETHHNDLQKVVCGKIAISHCILLAERKSDLATRQGHELVEVRGKVAESWLIPLVQLLQPGTPLDEVAGVLQNVGFIIFNYDRCVEHFLHSWLQLHYGINPGTAAEILNGVEFHHPYGSVGRLPWQKGTDQSVPFGMEPSADHLAAIANGVRTYSEQITDATDVRAIHNTIKNSVKAVFLGFSYGEQNMKLLSQGQRGAVGHIYGTTYGMSKWNSEHARGEIINCFKLHIDHQSMYLEPTGCAQFLRDFSRALS